MTRVIHTGDTHIGYQQYHSPDRREDFLRAFEQVVTDAVEDDVDAVVHAGDLFHDRRPDLQDLLGVLEALRRLSAADVPFLAIVGNHESTRGGQWLDLFERLGLATRLGREPSVVGETAFYGLDHVPKSRRDELEYDFEPHDAARAALVAHGLFTPFAHADWETETVLGESNVAFDAVLLGDNHAADTAEVAGAWVTYCGSTERASASERAGRGYNIVTFEADPDADPGVDIRRRSLETRPFAFVDVELGSGEGGDRVREQVHQHDLADAVAVVTIDGDGDPVMPASVEESALEEGALLARVTDRREIAAESDVEVSFADPDAAVRERLSELGLSQAALDIDETIRASKVADANVREEVTSRIEALADDPDAFRPADTGGDADDGASDGESGEDGGASDGESGVDDGASDGESGVDDGASDGESGVDDEASDGESGVDDGASDGESGVDEVADAAGDDSVATDGTATRPTGSAGSDASGETGDERETQSSMEEYL